MKTHAAVEISTPAGIVYRGRASAIEFETSEGRILINALEHTYLSVLSTVRITLRQGEQCSSFELENASASWRDGVLTVVAERAVPLPEETDLESRTANPTKT